MKNILRNHLTTECHAIFINKCGEQVQFEGEDKVLEATRFLGRHLIVPAVIYNECKEDYSQKSDSYSIETEKGNIHLTNITYKGGKYA